MITSFSLGFIADVTKNRSLTGDSLGNKMWDVAHLSLQGPVPSPLPLGDEYLPQLSRNSEQTS